MLYEGVCHLCGETTQVYKHNYGGKGKGCATCVSCIARVINLIDGEPCGNCVVYGMYTDRKGFGPGNGEGLCMNCMLDDVRQLGVTSPDFGSVINKVRAILKRQD